MWFHGSFRSRLLGLSKVNQEIGRTILQPPESIESNQFRKEFLSRKWWRHLSPPGNLTRWASCEAQTGNLSSGGFAFDCRVQSDIPWLPWHQSFPFFPIWLIPFHGNWGSMLVYIFFFLTSFKFASVLISRRTFRTCPSGAGKAVCSAPATRNHGRDVLQECIQNWSNAAAVVDH